MILRASDAGNGAARAGSYAAALLSDGTAVYVVDVVNHRHWGRSRIKPRVVWQADQPLRAP